MQLLLTAAQLSSLPSAAVANAQTLETRADHDVWLHWLNLSPHLFLFVNREGFTVTPVLPWSEGATKLDLKHRSDQCYLQPVVTLSANPNAAQGVWAEVTDTEPKITVMLGDAGAVNIATVGGQAVPTPNSLAMVPVGDQSVFFVESSTLLGSSATFTGPLRDAAFYNWFGAKSGVSGAQAGTLDIDESSASSGANIYQVATQATAASAAAHGSPATFTGAEARIAPTKTVLRFLRVVYVNGAAAQTGTFDLESALSPLN